MTLALDTSVLVRILSNIPQPLAADVISTVADRIANGDEMYVSDLVLSEAYYAMQHHYGVDKRTVLQSLKFMSEQKGFFFTTEAKAVLSINGLEHMNPGLVDRLIHAEGERQGMPVLSCEKSFRRLANAEVIP